MRRASPVGVAPSAPLTNTRGSGLSRIEDTKLSCSADKTTHGQTILLCADLQCEHGETTQAHVQTLVASLSK